MFGTFGLFVSVRNGLDLNFHENIYPIVISTIIEETNRRQIFLARIFITWNPKKTKLMTFGF